MVFAGSLPGTWWWEWSGDIAKRPKIWTSILGGILTQHNQLKYVGHNLRYLEYTAKMQKKVSQITTLKIVTLTEHLKVFSLHTPSVPDFNTIWLWTWCLQNSYCVKVWNTWCVQTEHFQMFEKCYNFQCSNLGHFFFHCSCVSMIWSWTFARI